MLSFLKPFKIVPVVLCIASTSLLSQSFEEYLWAGAHPIAALKVKKAKRMCDSIYFGYVRSATPDSFESGGKLDAFRHAFYMSVFTQKVRVKALRKLGRAHEHANLRNYKKHKTEEGDSADEIFSEMDLYNNELGFVIGSKAKGLSKHQLAEVVLQNISDGHAKIILRNCSGRYVSCDNLQRSSSAVTVMPGAKKCLVPSNQNCVN